MDLMFYFIKMEKKIKQFQIETENIGPIDLKQTVLILIGRNQWAIIENLFQL